jgi:hypothetical protein
MAAPAISKAPVPNTPLNFFMLTSKYDVPVPDVDPDQTKLICTRLVAHNYWTAGLE